MKSICKLLVIAGLPVLFASCGPDTEYHTVRVYEYSKPTPSKPKPKPVKSDDPRDFVPKERF
ncbi:hypothetical protein OJ996_14460 [Luteolibacter sp. GHJ8]|uniref:Lipoprotein n=1 Tax=Luteolibacter rhizosphaerae TaxID=2989719 RepID=A0ABT3G4L8_9BACT|nr:hypothetical protein [Luteolibacter rhizosphaerae]MCW1914786.1 hypothetical protein [Luteolibacter rhizosphaerae]